MNKIKILSFLILLFGLIGIFFVSSGYTIEKKIGKNCLECHTEIIEKLKKEGPIWHSPVKNKECLSCHRPHGFIRGAFLWRQLPYLCLKCHKEFGEKLKNKYIHSPVKKGNCNKCHGIHASQEAKLLKEKANNLCLECHKEIILGERKHQALNKGCLTCHDPHTSSQIALLKNKKEKICFSCHSKSKIKDIHLAQEVKTECLSCHNPHSSDKLALLRVILHKPAELFMNLMEKENVIAVICLTEVNIKVY